MSDTATLTSMSLPAGGRVTVHIEVSQDLNISAFAARQKANRFLLMQIGDQTVAGEPELVVGSRIAWRLPVLLAPSRRGVIGPIGHLLVDAETGEITIDDNQTAAEIVAAAEALYARTTPAAGA
jgi:hypothetical protein